ncbi:hypothetical protein [Streptomyces clavuligerus]|uniref:Putative membrane protein n=1 Tax=Streptomyces clavuligerus TaxID=1901 RepID=B5GXS2_STRCL|nr:hypothetical protein [Streptomyces clavuligerus]ANW20648.1 DUF2567 domain-containing protein [Streptomyces clavuligerus]AXU15273.1 DUF2567 domain-containing protein [Streptomyces clavuligerus]EDY51118.1 conserved hypothetical protein [Streptomyces clavuligerus]EFG06347.1 Putative membrane protein [Streptomyces clavuligerus]MBY6305354.1 DUF2567 domain-containing protein [Streptomyces clavuligerus]
MTVPLSPPPNDDPWQAPPPEDDGSAAAPDRATEVREGVLVLLAVTVTGVALGLLWLWLAPRVPLISDGKAVFLENSEGEEAVGADGVFALLALGFGVLTAVGAFLYRRRGGVPLVVGLALGGILASVLAWRLGVWLGPDPDVAAHARSVGRGVPFDAPLKLTAKGMLLAWPIAAMVTHLLLTALFAPRDPEPLPPAPAAWPPRT